MFDDWLIDLSVVKTYYEDMNIDYGHMNTDYGHAWIPIYSVNQRTWHGMDQSRAEDGGVTEQGIWWAGNYIVEPEHVWEGGEEWVSIGIQEQRPGCWMMWICSRKGLIESTWCSDSDGKDVDWWMVYSECEILVDWKDKDVDWWMRARIEWCGLMNDWLGTEA